MKKLIFFFLISPSFLMGCVLSGLLSDQGQGSLIIGASKGDESSSSARARNLRGQCEDNTECLDICEDIYGEFDDSDEENEGRVEKCSKLSYNVVDTFLDIVDVLEDPAYSKLQNLDASDFSEFLDVSVKPWIEYIKGMRRSESEVVLRWIATEKSVADAIISAYENYEDFDLYDGVYKLFMDLAPDLSSEPDYGGDTNRERRECSEIVCAIFSENIGGGKNFHKFSKDSNNRSANFCNEGSITESLVNEFCSSVNVPDFCPLPPISSDCN